MEEGKTPNKKTAAKKAGVKKDGRGKMDLHKYGKKFSSEYQPENYRKPDPFKFLTNMLVGELNSEREITVEGIDPKTGKLTQVRVAQPTKEVIVNTLLRLGAKGSVKAIEMIFDRVEGKVTQGIIDETPKDPTGKGERYIQLSDGTKIPMF